MSVRSDPTEGSATEEKADSRSVFEEVRLEWRLLWQHCIVDKERAESIAREDYPLLFVDRGVVIIATRAVKPLSFREILDAHAIPPMPPPSVGGWRKFSRTVLNAQQRWRGRPEPEAPAPRPDRRKHLQRKKGGMGWLHSHSP